MMRKTNRALTTADYSVGYGKPPKAKKGKPSPHKGRKKPRLPETTGELFRRLAFGQITVAEAGKKKKVSRFNAAYKAIYNKMAGGDLAAERLINRFKKAFPGPGESDEPIIIIED